MLTKTSGIVLRTIKYSDKSSIATVYTREFGRTSYMVYGMSGRKSGHKAALFLPLSIIEINAAHSPEKEVQQLKEVRSECALTGISSDPVKNAIALFLSELLYKTLRQPEADKLIFDFLQHAIQLLDQSHDGIANFHLVFMVKYAGFWGFRPNKENTDLDYFDLQNGVFLKSQPAHPHFLNKDITRLFILLLDMNFDKLHTLNLSRLKRNEILDSLIEYYQLHIPDFHGLNSTTVLHELFNET